ncbi:MAG TPA: hypothetical protein VM553_21775, partial [Dongiaceae bacterium]|nr:hypothetical protein [Dongiaceae bacterium]
QVTPQPIDPVLSGHLWHTNYALDYLDGAQIASLNGELPQRVTNSNPAWPWRDGTQYVVADADTDSTAVSVRITGSSNTRYDYDFDGYVRDVKPSPISKDVMLATWSEDSISDATYEVFDLANAESLQSIIAEDLFVDWLPDGRLLRVTASGQITASAIGGATQALGALDIPDGREIHRMWVNAQGTQLALRLVTLAVDGSIDRSDLWIADIDGNNLGQLTDTGISNYAKWSPDGRHIAFDTDTGLTCNGGGCVGQCSLWYVDADARKVLALESSGDAEHFRVKDSKGNQATLGCELQAWTE